MHQHREYLMFIIFPSKKHFAWAIYFSDIDQGHCKEHWLTITLSLFRLNVFGVLMLWARLLTVFLSQCVPTMPSVFMTYRELMVTAQNRKCRVIALLSRAKALALTGHGDSEITGPGWPWPRQMQTLQCSSVSQKGQGRVWIVSKIPDAAGDFHQSKISSRLYSIGY